MGKVRKSWAEKLAAAKAKPGLPKVFFCDQAKLNFVVPSPGEIEQIIQGIPRGKLMTIGQMCDSLRQAHHVDVACPLTTGIFSWIIAHAAAEDAAAGRKRVTPWWRVLKTGGLLNPKFPGGGETQKAMLEAEGHQIVGKGKKIGVADYEAALVKP